MHRPTAGHPDGRPRTLRAGHALGSSTSSLFLIDTYQNALLQLITLPAMTDEQDRGDFGSGDVIAALAFLMLLGTETVAGAVLLTLLFIGSTILTEKISAQKYPEYADHRAATSAVIPWFPWNARVYPPSTV